MENLNTEECQKLDIFYETLLRQYRSTFKAEYLNHPALSVKNFDCIQTFESILKVIDYFYFKSLSEVLFNTEIPISLQIFPEDLPPLINYYHGRSFITKFQAAVYQGISKISRILEIFQKNPPSYGQYYNYHLSFHNYWLIVLMNSQKDNGSSQKDVNSSYNQKTTGIYYTSKNLAKRITYQTLNHLIEPVINRIETAIINLRVILDKDPDLDLKNLDQKISVELKHKLDTLLRDLLFFTKQKILDPACGTGIFLYCAARYLRSKFKILNNGYQILIKGFSTLSYPDKLPKKISIFKEESKWNFFVFSSILFGIDADPVAIILAKVILLLDIVKYIPFSEMFINLILPNFYWGDSLLSPFFPKPEYKTIQNYHQTIIGILTHKHIVEKQFLDIFVEIKHDLLSPFSKSASSLKGFHFTNFLYNFSQKSIKSSLLLNYKKIKQDYRQQLNEITKKHLDLLNISPPTTFIDYNSDLTINAPFFSWILAFPEIFYDSKEKFQEDGGFTAIITNPPWEVHQYNIKEFDQFVKISKDIIFPIKTENSQFIRKSTHHIRSQIEFKQNYWNQTFYKQTEQKYNLFKLFFELCLSLPQRDINLNIMTKKSPYKIDNQEMIGGMVGILTPAGILTEARANPLRAALIEHFRLHEILQLYTGEQLFPSITSGQPLSILIFQNAPPSATFQFQGGIKNLSMWNPRSTFTLHTSLLNRLSPTYQIASRKFEKSYAFPMIDSSEDMHLIQHILSFPKLQEDWQLNAHRELNRTDDVRNGIIGESKSSLPVLEGKYLVHYGYSIENARFFVQNPEKYAEYRPIVSHSRIVWRNVSNIRLRRRMFVALIPPNIPTVNSLNYLTPYRIIHGEKIPLEADELIYLTGMLGSLVAEYFLRFFSSNNNLNQYLILNLPIPSYTISNDLHISLIQLLKDTFPIFQEWASKMVRLGRDYRAKHALEKQYWPILAKIDALTLKIFQLSLADLPTIQDKFPKISSEYFLQLRKAYDEFEI